MSFEHDKRIIIYPNYINSRMSVAEGRRVPVPKACEDPTIQEILDSLKHLKLPAEPENKAYPRFWLVRGRVRVELKNSDGSLVNPEIPNRRTLLKRIAELIPRHPNRQGKKVGQSSSGGSLMAAATAAAAVAAGGSSSTAAPSKQQAGKKAGKKKK